MQTAGTYKLAINENISLNLNHKPPNSAMNWYYYEGEDEMGPVSPSEFKMLYEDGVITDDTPVRSDALEQPVLLFEAIRSGAAEELELDTSFSALEAAGSAEMVTGNDYADADDYSTAPDTAISPPAQPLQPAMQDQSEEGPALTLTQCPTCESQINVDDLIPMGDVTLCPNCREEYLQSLKEGVVPTVDGVEYATFGARLAGLVLDSLLVGVVNFAVQMLLGLALAPIAENDAGEILFFLVYVLFSMGVPFGYTVFFLGHPEHQATLGMKAAKIRIIAEDGGDCTYKRAFGRTMAAIISGLILYIGYLMCLWDERKQTLHDKMAKTLVIKQH